MAEWYNKIMKKHIVERNGTFMRWTEQDGVSWTTDFNAADRLPLQVAEDFAHLYGASVWSKR